MASASAAELQAENDLLRVRLRAAEEACCAAEDLLLARVQSCGRHAEQLRAKLKGWRAQREPESFHYTGD